MKTRPEVKNILLSVLAVAVAGAAIYYGASSFFLEEAKKDIQDVLLSHRGLHHYIQRNMHPSFYSARDRGLIADRYYDPVIFSSSYIVRVLHRYHNEERIKSGLPAVYYKLAADNPRNPLNRSDDFESGILKMFNEDRGLREYQTVISRKDGRYLYYAIPFLVTEQRCLKCHGKREDAPAGLQALYPGEGGFNDRVGNIRAVESMSVPIDDTMRSVYVITGSLMAGCLMLFISFVFNSRLRVKVDEKTRELLEEIEVRKKTEEHISQTLREKEILLREIHHRVKNNMAMITSLIDMKSIKLPGEGLKAVFRDLRQRIKTISGVHEKLYHSPNLRSISLSGYIGSLVKDIKAAYGSDMNTISLEVQVEELLLTIDTLIPLGLIINEIVTNAIKHAFAGIENPEIRISLKAPNRENIHLEISDNGTGIPAERMSGTGTTGLEIISALVMQLKGNMNIDCSRGTRYTIAIKSDGDGN